MNNKCGACGAIEESWHQCGPKDWAIHQASLLRSIAATLEAGSAPAWSALTKGRVTSHPDGSIGIGTPGTCRIGVQSADVDGVAPKADPISVDWRTYTGEAKPEAPDGFSLLREELRAITDANSLNFSTAQRRGAERDQLRAELAAAIERAERESRSNALYRGLLDDQHAAYRAIDRDLTAAQRDLREAVDALRPFAKGHNPNFSTNMVSCTSTDTRNAAAIIARFEATEVAAKTKEGS